MHRELVEERRWISEKRFLHALNYCMLLPGPEAQQLATYIGWLMHRTWGGIVAGALFVLPSLAILIALSWIYLRFGDVPAVAGILYGIKPAVTAIVLAAAWRIGSRALKHPLLWAIAVAAFVAIFAFDVPFPADRAGGGAARDGSARAWRRRVRRQRRARRRRGVARPGADRRRHAARCAHALVDRSRTACAAGLRGAVVCGHRRAGPAGRLERHADADGVVLHQGRAADLRRGLRGAAVRRAGRRSSTTAGSLPRRCWTAWRSARPRRGR